MNPPLDVIRILVPPSRPEANPLLKILRTRGAEVLEWPLISPADPEDYGPMDRAILRIDRFDWILFSGSRCVTNFLFRLDALGADRTAVFSRNLAAVGHGALVALKKAGAKVSAYPERHVAEDVAAAVGEKNGLRGKHCLLVRVAGASDLLPGIFQARGAEVEEVEGYRLQIDAGGAAATWEPRPNVVAFANPAAVRIFAEALKLWGRRPADVLAGVEVACVGPATADETRRLDIEAAFTSGGSQADLVSELVSRFQSRSR